MNRNQVNVYLAAIVTTALETEPASFPESYGYLAVGSVMEDWVIIKELMILGKLATFDGNCIRLTDAGRIVARKVNQARASA